MQGRQNRLHLSQGDTTEKSECKTLISPDPDEGSLQSQRETLCAKGSYWLASLEQKKTHTHTHAQNTKIGSLYVTSVALHRKIKLCCCTMCACTVQVACLLVRECVDANEEIETWRPLWLLCR